MSKKIIQLAEHTRAAEFDAAKGDKDKRTVPLVWSTGARVLRSSWDDGPWYEELSMDPAHIRMDRLRSGATPLLDDHDKYGGVSSVLGAIEDAEISDGVGRAMARFSKRADVEPVYQDVLDKIIRGVSVGYKTRKLQRMSDADDGIPVYRAVDWEPLEVSLTPIGADAGAGTRSVQEKTHPCEIVERAEGATKGNQAMPPVTETTTATPAAPAAAAAQPAPAIDQVAIRAEAVKAERERVTAITLSCRSAGCSDEFREKLVTEGVALDAARAAIIEDFARRGSKPSQTARVEAGTLDETETRRASIESAILNRHDSKAYPLQARGNEYCNMSLLEISRELLEARGEKVKGLSKTELANRAITTSDLPSIVANVANKTLRDAYQAAPQTFKPFTREVELPDFKPVNRTQLGDAPALELVGEDGSVKRGTITDGKQVYALAEYAKILPITRITIINDDMGALTRIPMLMGRAAADLESDLIYTGKAGLFSANSAAGQKLTIDNNPVFYAAHGNLAGSGAAIAVATIGAGRSAMRQQKNLQGRPISVYPKFLLVPTALETVADQFVTSAMLANQPSNTNPFASRLQVIPEPRLDALSTTAWYLLADYGQVDICEIAYLAGQRGVYFETRQGFDVEGIEFKARLDVAASFVDWRGAYKNPGA